MREWLQLSKGLLALQRQKKRAKGCAADLSTCAHAPLPSGMHSSVVDAVLGAQLVVVVYILYIINQYSAR